MKIREKILNRKMFVIFMCVCLLFLLPPQLLWNTEFFSRFDFYFRFLSIAAIGAGWLFSTIKNKRISNLILLAGAFSLVLIISTILNHGDLKQALWGNSIVPVAILLGLEQAVDYDKKTTVLVIFFFFWISVIINFFTMLPLMGEPGFIDLLNEHSLFGNRNWHVYYFFILLLSGGYAYFQGYIKKYLFFFSYVCCCFSFLFTKGITTFIILLAWGVYFLVRNWKIIKALCKSWLCMGINLLIFIGLQSYALSGSWEALEWLTTLNRRRDFNGRFPFWQLTWEEIGKSPVLGHGYRDMFTVLQTAHPHNIYLHILVNRGVIGFSIFVLILVAIALTVKKMKNTEIGRFFVFFMFCILLAGQVDECSISYYALYAGLIYYLAKSEAAEKYEG